MNSFGESAAPFDGPIENRSLFQPPSADLSYRFTRKKRRERFRSVPFFNGVTSGG
jgi:hypothetical protein